MSFVRYQIGNIQQIIQFDEDIIIQTFKQKFYLDFCLKLEDGFSVNPTVKVSKKPPNNIKEWQKSNFKFHKDIIVYSKIENNKFYFHVQFNTCELIETYIKVNIVFNLMLVSHILRNNILRVHAMLLTNGDIIFSQCCGGKTTLAQRINLNNRSLQVICDDGILIDMENQLVYPLPFLYDFHWSRNLINFNKTVKVNRIIFLKKDKEQYLKIISENEWKENFTNCSKLFLSHPFLLRDQQFDETKNQKWIDSFQDLKYLIQNRIEYLIQKYIKNYNFWCIATNTIDISKKFEIIEDKI